MKIIISERQQRLIKENSVRDSLIDMIKNDGWKEVTDIVGGDQHLKKLTGINTPMDFLHLFDDLDIVDTEENPNWTLFRYKPKRNLMIYDRKNEYVYINFHEIWEVLEDNFKLDYLEVRKLTKEWLSEVYNLKVGDTTWFDSVKEVQRLS